MSALQRTLASLDLAAEKMKSELLDLPEDLRDEGVFWRQNLKFLRRHIEKLAEAADVERALDDIEPEPPS